MKNLNDTSDLIVIDELKLSYRFYKGDTKDTLVTFHGFGQTSIVFESFIPSVLPYYSVVAIDLFFHGESTIEDNEVNYISIERWNTIFEQILIKHQISRFSLLSYSMGSRFIVTLLNVYAPRISKIALIAPDGFGNNFWFNVSTSTQLTRFIFRYSMQHPLCIQIVVRMLGAVGIYNSITKRFIERNLESAKNRMKIYTSWVYFRKLTIRKDDFVELILNNEINFICFCGKEDQLVAKKKMELICNKTNACYIELNLAHHKMIQVLGKEKLVDFLISDW